MAGPSSKKAKEGSNGKKFEVGDVVLAKIKGFPAWPGVLVGDDQVPNIVLREKPAKKFIIRFFPKADYHFPAVSDLTHLSREDCQAYAEDTHRKDGELKEAYKIGADPDEWIAETDAVVREAEQARKDDEREKEENEDQLVDEDEEEESKPKKAATSKKRSAPSAKPSSSAAGNKKQKAEPKESKTAAAARKSVGGDDDAADDAELDEATKKVKAWRHALQRAFLPKGRNPTEADIQGHQETFAIVEQADITFEQLRTTKINKVMRKIISLESIPQDDVHHFKERAEALLAKWTGASGPSSGGGLEVGDSNAKKSAVGVEGNASTEEVGTADVARKEEQTNGDAGAGADVGDLTELPDVTAAADGSD